ncbi:DUF2946 family protein [Sphingomonas sp.]|uniref:DUF2946 family protein n=1 Tax=Sphingomonas sp. TaxID=28214 RepID=UPI002DD69526|nr:DUF2946 family protein [Sphingomonas sp.]
MHSLRRLVLVNRPLACAIIALALMMKLVMPSGFMTTVVNGQIVVSVCSGTGPTTMVITIPDLEHQKPAGNDHQGKVDQPCAFAGLSMPSLGAADPLLLAIATLFALALGMRATPASTATTPVYLRPPLRGPPAI